MAAVGPSISCPVTRTRSPAFRTLPSSRYLTPSSRPTVCRLQRLALVGEAGVAADHEQAADLAQIGDDVLGDPVGEILLLRIAAHVVERQDGYRGLVVDLRIGGLRRRSTGLRGGWRSRARRYRPWTGRAMFLSCCSPLSSNATSSLLPTCRVTDCRHRDAARLGDAFESRGDIDAVAEDIVVLDDHVAEVDADAEFDPPIFRAFRRCGFASRAGPPARIRPRRPRLEIRPAFRRRSA